MNKIAILRQIREVAGKIAELQAAVEQFQDITEEQLAHSPAAQSSPETASDRQREILFVDKPSIQSQVAQAFTEMSIQGTPIGAEQVQKMVAACGVKPEANTFSQTIVDMREIQP